MPPAFSQSIPPHLVELLTARARECGDRRCYSFFEDGENESESLTYRELERRVRIVAGLLGQFALTQQPVLLLYPPGLDYICAFLGCQYAGAIPVPAYPPRANRSIRRLAAMVDDAQLSVALGPEYIRQRLRAAGHHAPSLDRLRFLSTDAAAAQECLADPHPDISPDWIALLQYTSGSTRQPRGVVVTHANLMHQQRLIYEKFGHGPESRVVSWLPPYHDMGLIGSLLQPLFGGFECLFMPPACFLQQPARWLRLISRYQATTSGGPDFAFSIATERITCAECQGLDLRSWSVAFNGSEPVSSHTMRKFTSRFQEFGFRSEAFYPCYGLAEATLMVAGGAKLSGFRESQGIVGCGDPATDHQILIVDPDSQQECAELEVGEIWVRGPSVAMGYWNKPDATCETFQAHLAGNLDQHFLRTGDLAFIDRGELFVTGRRSDLIILAGRNYHPHDLEAVALESDNRLQINGGAAFTTRIRGREELVLVEEISHSLVLVMEQIATAIRSAIADEFELPVFSVAFVRTGRLAKTSSGKLMRGSIRSSYEAGDLILMGEVLLEEGDQQPQGNRPRGEIETRLEAIWRELLPRSKVDLDTNFFAAGGDSITATRMLVRINEEFDTEIGLDVLFDSPTLRELSTKIANARFGLPRPQAELSATVPSGAVYPLTPAQRRIWFSEQVAPGNPFYHIGVLIEMNGSLERSALAAALAELLSRNEALRAVFLEVDAEPRQRFATGNHVPLPTIDLSRLAYAVQRRVMAEITKHEAKRRFDLRKGPLLRASLLDLGGKRSNLILSIHHIACDGWALRVLLQELDSLYRSYLDTTRPFLPASPSFREHCIWSHGTFPREASYQSQRTYWKARLGDGLKSLELATDYPRPRITLMHGARVEGDLDQVFVQRIMMVAATHNTTLFTIMLCALKIVLMRATNQREITVGAAVANRVHQRWESVVGCLMNFVVMRTAFPHRFNSREAIELVRSTCLEALVNQEYPFEQVVDDLKPTRRLQRTPLYHVGFWLHNRPLPTIFEGVLKSSVKLVDTDSSELDLRVIATVGEDGALDLALEYSTELFHRETVQNLYNDFVNTLRMLIEDPNNPFEQRALTDAEITKTPEPTITTPITIVINSTFTADPVEQPLAYWFRKLDLLASICIAPYQQLFQQLLDPRSNVHRNSDSVNIFLIELRDWLGDGIQSMPERQILEMADRFLECLRSPTLASHHAIVCVSSSPDGEVSPAVQDAMLQARQKILQTCNAIAGVSAVDLGEVAALYKVEKIWDPYTQELGHIPFSEEMFAALSGYLARRVRALFTKPCKVLVLDCDQTLWSGYCGEGAAEVTAPYAELQKWAIRLRQAGLLLCLCSKNEEQDVRTMLDAQLGGDLLEWSHFAAVRVNWQAKSENLKSLSEQLGLPLDSFLFLDDCAIECQEVMLRSPQVMCLQLPAESDEIPDFLHHIWPLDQNRITWEDSRRTEMYRQEHQRDQLRQTTPTLAEFIQRLNVQITISPAQIGELDRLAQLTQRTNQFNLTGVVHSSRALFAMISNGPPKCWSVRVRDTFGDSGLVGLIICDAKPPVLEIDSFLLSCRALGRNVEQTMWGKIVEISEAEACSTISLQFRRTHRNTPAFEFLSRIHPFPDRSASNTWRWDFPSTSQFQPTTESVATSPPTERRSRDMTTPVAANSPIYQQVAELRRASQIVDAVRSSAGTVGRTSSNFVAPRGPVEQRLAEIWSEVLGISQIGAHDNFFDFGGHSLRAARVLTRVRDEFQVELPLLDLFEQPTVAGLAAAIARKLVAELHPNEAMQLIQETKKRFETGT